MFYVSRTFGGITRYKPVLFGALISLWMTAEGWHIPAVMADLPHPQLTTVFPSGGKAGGSIEVTVSGADLDEVDRLMFSHPGIQATPKMSGATDFEKPRLAGGVFTVQIAADVPLGLHEVRVAGRFGVSNPRAFVVGNRNEVNKAGGNNQRDKAVELPLGTVVNGRADGSNVDYYKLTLKAGQRVLVECKAQQIDSRMDPTLVLYDASGRELSRNRDATGRDALLDITPPSDGVYTLGVFDYTFGGGGEHFYRLVADIGPYVDFVFPSAGQAGSNGQYTLFGRGLPGGQPAEGVVVHGKQLEKLTVNIALPGDEVARRQLAVPLLVPLSAAAEDSFEFRFTPTIGLPIYFGTAPAVLEQEPNNAIANAQKVAVPCEISGQFYPNRDEDWFQFDGKKGQSFVVEIISQRMGVYADPYLILQRVNRNEKGEEVVANLAQLDDPGDRSNRIGGDFDLSTDDPSFRLDIPDDGVYRVMVRDQFGSTRKDPRSQYRLAIRTLQPDFRLTAITQPLQAPANPAVLALGAISLRKGGTAIVDVRVERRDGFDGDIEFAVEGLPPTITCPVAVIGGDVNSTPLVFVAADAATRWEGVIRIVGRAKIANQDVSRYARAAYAVWGTANRAVQSASFRMARDLTLAVNDKETDVALLIAAEDKVLETSKGGKLDISIKVTRRGDFKADLNLAPVGLPNELKPANLAIKGDQAEGKLAFAATNANAKLGTYTFVVRADTKVKHVRNPEAQTAAEEEQKNADAKLKEFTEATQKATVVKDAAVKAAPEAATALTQAQQAKTAAENESKQAAEAAKKAAEAAVAAKQQADTNAGNQDLANAAAAAEKAKTEAIAKEVAATEKLTATTKAAGEAQTKSKAAEEAKVAAEKAFAEMDAKMKATQAAKQGIDKRLDEIKNANAPKDLDAAFVSTPIKVRLVASPIQLAVVDAPAPIPQGQKIEIPLTVARLYGFDSPVEVTLEPPQGVAGLTVNKVTIPKEQTAGKFEVMAASNATVGDHVVTVRAKSQFNSVNVETVSKITVKVAAPAK